MKYYMKYYWQMLEYIEYYSFIIVHEVLMYFLIWTNLPNILLSERRHNKGCMSCDSIFMEYPEWANPQK